MDEKPFSTHLKNKYRRYFDGLTTLKYLLTAFKTNVCIDAAANIIANPEIGRSNY